MHFRLLIYNYKKMNKNIKQKNILWRVFLSGTTLALVFSTSLFGVRYAQAAITSSLDIGSTGSDVTELQTYLATNASIYPSGLVTGYFGPLTQAAVQRFQTAQGLVSSGSPDTTGYGRVGPQTMMRINSLLVSGGNNNNQMPWDVAPILSTPAIQYSDRSVVMTWTTNEPAQGQVYYDTIPLRSDEATGPRQLPYVSGANVTGSTGQIYHTITIQNLQPNTLYYYLTRAVDSSGNMSMTWPSSFRTNQ